MPTTGPDPRDPRVQQRPEQIERVRLSLVAVANRRPGPGRRTVLTEELIDEMAQLIEDGLPIDKTCDLVGIWDNDYANWMKRGNAYLQADDPVPFDALYGMFAKLIRTALARFQNKLVQRSIAPDFPRTQWRRDLAILERRDRKNWSRASVLTLQDEETPNPDERFL